MSDTDAPRPRPQYGEYATPEEVAKIMGTDAPARRPQRSAPITASPLATPPVATPPPSATHTPPARHPDMDARRGAVRADQSPLTRPMWDLVLSALLVGLGVWRSAGYLVDPGWFGTSLKTEMTTLGDTTFAVDTYISRVGEIYTAVDATLLIVAGILTIRAARRARPRYLLTIPLGFAVLSVVCSGIAIYVAIRHDPAALAYLNTR